MSAVDITLYGAKCQRVGSLLALAAHHKSKGHKKEAAKLWAAYYDAEKEKEQCLQQLLKTLGLSTRKGSARSST